MSLYLGTTPIANDGSHNTANIDLSNLSNTGEAHFANPALTNSPYTTNRILEIPQNIKLELNNGTLTLKAGSKLYYPNGFESDGTTPKFSEYIVPNDYSFTGGNYGFERTHVLSFGGNQSGINGHAEPEVGLCYSGTTAPTGISQYAYWWDLSINRFKWTRDSGSTWELFGTSLPVALFHYNGEDISGIDQVFNGFGYIGSMVFALPGVKVQTPNGKNADGTYKTVIRTVDSVKTNNTSTSGTSNLNIVISGGIDSIVFETLTTDLFTYNKKFSSSTATFSYDENSEQWWFSNDQSSWMETSLNIVGSCRVESGKITQFQVDTVDSVVNSNASNFSQAGRSYLSGLGMTSNRYIDLTLGASNSTYTAPANGTVLCVKRAKDVGQSLGLARVSSDIFFDFAWNSVANTNIFLNMDIRKGEDFCVYYTASGTEVQILRFYYAEGEE